MYPVFLEQGEQVGITRLWHIAAELGIRRRAVAGAALRLTKRRFEIPGDGIAGEGHVLDIALLDLLQEAGVGEVDRRLLRTQGTKEERGVEDQIDDDDEDEPSQPGDPPGGGRSLRARSPRASTWCIRVVLGKTRRLIRFALTRAWRGSGAFHHGASPSRTPSSNQKTTLSSDVLCSMSISIV